MESFRTHALSDRPRLLGLAVGAVGLLISIGFEAVIPGRLLGDPLPLVLALSGMARLLTSGLLYFDWQTPLLHLAFAGALGIGAAWSVRRWADGPFPAERSRRAASAAAAVNVAIPALLEIDSLQVLLFYAASGFVSISITNFVAAWAAGRRRKTG